MESKTGQKSWQGRFEVANTAKKCIELFLSSLQVPPGLSHRFYTEESAI